MAEDPFALQRFVDAQEHVIDRVRAELAAGAKQSHWMWFVFPQIAGLGFSPMAQSYAVRSADEARAYLEHPVLGPRLRDCVELVLQHRDRSAHDIFGSPDDLKFRSCLTLFDHVQPGGVLRAGLDAFFGGKGDAATLQKLGGGQ